MKKHCIVIITLIIAVVILQACEKMLTRVPENDSILDGPIDGLTNEQHAIFLRGDVAFNDEVFTKETGLGPLFVATSCGACHAGDGKGHPFTTLTRFGQSDTTGNKFLNMGGPQLQHRAIPGYINEVIPAGATFSRFLPPANTGLGLLDAVTDADLIALSDPYDVNGDGISGRPNWIHIPSYADPRPNSIEINNRYMGRFGKKGAAYDLLQQTANAYNQDIGISSAFESMDTYSGHHIDPEISTQTVLDVVFYLRTLKAPIQRNQQDADVIAGKQVFLNIGCGKCHTPELKTGISSIAALSQKTFFPYTDMLLHDMGAGLNDGYTEGTALTQEWKTPALWGLGLSKKSQGGQYFLLHDGRARSIQQAIEMHGGESQQVRNNYQQLNPADQAKLIKFLESL